MTIMVVFSQQLANFMGDPEVTNGVRALAPAVMFACIVSVYRGYSQGFSNMMPTAISQVMEFSFNSLRIVIAWSCPHADTFIRYCGREHSRFT